MPLQMPLQMSLTTLHTSGDRTPSGRWARVVACAALTMLGALPAGAITVAWDHAGGGHWAVASNWSPVGVPGPADDVFISMASASPYTVLVNRYNNQVQFAAGSVKITQANATLSVQYTSGVSGAELALADTLAITAGTLRLAGAGDKVAYVHADHGMSFAAEALVKTQGNARLGGSIANTGTLDMKSGGYLDGTGTLENQGLVTLSAAGASIYTAIGHTMLNGGTFEVTAPVGNYGQVSIGTFTNLQGGTVRLQGQTKLRLTQPGLVNHGVVELADDRATVTVLSGTPRLVNAADGVIELQVGNGGVRIINTTLDNAGLVEVAADLLLNGYQAAHVNSGRMHLANSATATISGVSGTSFTNTATGRIDGNGTLDLRGLPSFIDHGTLSPGNSFGRIDILGNYRQAADGVLDIEIGSGGQDLIVVDGGTALFEGTLRVHFVDGFAPSQGDTFELISGAVTASFSHLEVLGLAPGYDFELAGNGGLALVAVEVPPVPEPGPTALLLAGLAVVGWRARARGHAGAPR